MTKKGIQTKTLIKEEAKHLFARKGFKSVTMTDICEATGLSRGGLYRHYSSTAEIFRDIVSSNNSYSERIASGDSAKTILIDMLDSLEAKLTGSDSLGLALLEYASQDSEGYIDTINAQFRKQCEDIVKYGIKTDEFFSVDTNQITQILVYYYEGLRMWSSIRPLEDETIANYKRIICDLLLNE